jgi:hypothetical protein
MLPRELHTTLARPLLVPGLDPQASPNPTLSSSKTTERAYHHFLERQTDDPHPSCMLVSGDRPSAKIRRTHLSFGIFLGELGFQRLCHSLCRTLYVIVILE